MATGTTRSTAPDGRVYMVVGDVAGHGIGCATLANQLRIAIQVRANDGQRLCDILDLVDRELDDDFATCWLGAYDPESRRLRVANAGHMPAVLYRDGRCEFVAAHTRPPLGSGIDGADEVELHLEPGDVLVAFTDGLVERRAEPIGVGLDRLCERAVGGRRRRRRRARARRAARGGLAGRRLRDDAARATRRGRRSGGLIGVGRGVGLEEAALVEVVEQPERGQDHDAPRRTKTMSTDHSVASGAAPAETLSVSGSR